MNMDFFVKKKLSRRRKKEQGNKFSRKEKKRTHMKRLFILYIAKLPCPWVHPLVH
jgi:hypothetical protein